MWEVLQGDVRERLQDIPEKSIQCVVTSPPYFGLRSYDGGDAEIGLEKTPDEYVNNMVEVFRNVKRSLRDDGTVWLNLGDSYNGANMNRTGQHGFNDGRKNRSERYSVGGVQGLKPKDLCGMPWLVAFALRADGWYLRMDIIWHKPNPMPESVTDRPTKAHEYIFLLTKNQRYFYDAEAVKEPSAYPNDLRAPKGSPGAWQMDGRPADNNSGRVRDDNSKRNKRSVWTVSTRPCPGSHFAVFPPKLIEPCILAGSRPGDTVLDPFCGSGTTLWVAESHGRDSKGIELNSEYVKLIEKRMSNVQQTIFSL